MNLILLEPGEVAADGTAILRDVRARHVREVLKAAPGAQLRVGVVDGCLGLATVVADGPELRLACEWGPEIPPVPRLDLLLALPRPKVVNRLWPVLGALGVGRILVSNAGKTERVYFDTHVLHPEHIRARLLEGLQQARDTRLPQVSVHRQFRKLIEDDLDSFGPHVARFVAHPGRGAFPFDAIGHLPPAGRILLAIGPEGGWIPFELELLARHGFSNLSCGPRPLRTDTACAVLLGLLHAAVAIRAGLTSAQAELCPTERCRDQ